MMLDRRTYVAMGSACPDRSRPKGGTVEDEEAAEGGTVVSEGSGAAVEEASGEATSRVLSGDCTRAASSVFPDDLNSKGDWSSSDAGGGEVASRGCRRRLRLRSIDSGAS
ncbi:hypothetical protein GSI_12849 [Ganoderma sinense ZZ0214-1]|uniref:Uncharacterized protein n=1 Tax=Ganoderma sinense ZZ0214-1 TaxID=1077348 RepID=A0A2G8RTX1_9APHY|nr:hypothetical protein GSI_12849 [Ganoderma sinense ZZ0214-1]